jgi:hypothetical protein
LEIESRPKFNNISGSGTSSKSLVSNFEDPPFAVDTFERAVSDLFKRETRPRDQILNGSGNEYITVY